MDYFSPTVSAYFDKLIHPLTDTSLLLLIGALVVGVILQELGSYIRHYILHNNNVLWRSHEFHHSAESMSVLNVYRNAVSDNIPNIIVLPISLFANAIVAASLLSGKWPVVAIYLFYSIIHNINNYVGHSSLYCKHPFPIDLIFMSPYHHWIHHSSSQDHFSSNFNTTLLLWDKLFNTFKDVPKHEALKLEYGVADTIFNKRHPVLEYFLIPYIVIYKEIAFGLNKFISNLLCGATPEKFKP